MLFKNFVDFYWPLAVFSLIFIFINQNGKSYFFINSVKSFFKYFYNYSIIIFRNGMNLKNFMIQPNVRYFILTVCTVCCITLNTSLFYWFLYLVAILLGLAVSAWEQSSVTYPSILWDHSALKGLQTAKVSKTELDMKPVFLDTSAFDSDPKGKKFITELKSIVDIFINLISRDFIKSWYKGDLQFVSKLENETKLVIYRAFIMSCKIGQQELVGAFWV